MKRFFYHFGLIVLFIGSFVYTEKTISAVKELDNIMIEIRNNSWKYRKYKIEAIIDEDNNIIPGINGRLVNIEKSYQKMRSIGVYNEKYLIFDEEKVINSLDMCKDKYIKLGNPSKGAVSLIFEVKRKENLNKVLDVLRKYNINVTFFIDGKWLEENRDDFYKIISLKHDVGSIGYNYDYKNSSYSWLDNVIKIATGNDKNYCIKVDEDALEICKSRNNFTINPIVIDNSPFINTKKIIESGSIIYFKDNSFIVEELELIIKYINSKNYKILTISELIKE